MVYVKIANLSYFFSISFDFISEICYDSILP